MNTNSKRVCFLWLCFAFLLFTISLAGCGSDKDNPTSDVIADTPSVADAENLYQYKCKMFDGTDNEKFHLMLSDLCSQDLWNSRDCYDACSWLIVPMHYAFKAGDDYSVNKFQELFSKFTDYCLQWGGYNEESRVWRLQWLYLCSQYLALSSSFESYKNAFIPDLIDICVFYAEDNLYRSKATWKTEDTVYEHIKQVLAGKKYKYHYYSSLVDGDMFSLAVLCDAVYASRKNGIEVTQKMSTAADLAYEIYNSQLLNTETEEGGWLFQVGVGQDYKDNIYAGNTEITENMQPNPREDIVSDVSHFRRTAFFLTSYESAQESNERMEIFEKRKEQLGVQLKKCIVKVDGNWVQTSFMDGTNGVYRYSYHVEGVGHSNYSHSASLIHGWWAALYQDWIFDVYNDILSGFPWPQNETNPYWDIMTVREQNPYFDADTGWEKGWYECVVKCAVQLGKRPIK